MSDREDDIRQAAVAFVEAQGEMDVLRKEAEVIQRRFNEKTNERDAFGKTLMQSVGRNLDERHIRVEDSVVHVRFDAERGPSVRLVKLS